MILKSHKSCKHQWSGFNSYATVYDIHDVKVGLQSSPQTISNNKSQTGLLYIWNMSADDKNLALSSIELEIKCILSYLIKEFKFLSFHLWVVWPLFKGRQLQVLVKFFCGRYRLMHH